MKEIRMKKAARDQLPHLESDGTVELRHNKMAYGPKREASKNSWAGYRLQSENSDVCADEQSCESRHKNSLTVRAYFHTKVTKDHDGHNVRRSVFSHKNAELVQGEKRNKLSAVSTTSPLNSPFGVECCGLSVHLCAP